MVKFDCNHLSQISDCAKLVIDLCSHSKVWVFQGAMGAGKTTLIKAIAAELGIVDVVHSPTYGLVNVYEDYNNNTYYHFDFYRIDDPMEAVDMGVEEYLDSGNYCWIEWAEKIEALLPEVVMKISIQVIDYDRREISVTKLTNGGSD